MADRLFPEISHPKKRAFLAALAQSGDSMAAARAARIDRRSVYNWRHGEDTEFREAYKIAKELGADALESTAIQLATKGSKRPMSIGGKRELVTERFPTLLIFLLKGAMPEKYRERWEGQLTGKDGAPLMSEEQSRRALEATAPPPPTD
jgi:hypothetical protein